MSMADPDLPIDLQCIDAPVTWPTEAPKLPDVREDVKQLVVQLRNAIRDITALQKQQEIKLSSDAKTITDLTAQLKFSKRKNVVDSEDFKREKIDFEQQLQDKTLLQQSFDGVLNLLSYAHKENTELERRLQSAANRQDTGTQTQNQSMAEKGYYKQRNRWFKRQFGRAQARHSSI